MCGLYGIYSSVLSQIEKEDAVNLGWLNMTRGRDSTGIMVGYREEGRQMIDSCKRTTDASTFFAEKAVKELFDSRQVFFIAGHNRAATIGDINYNNAQPIREGNIIGQHNGTASSLAKQADKENVSDTRLLLRMINELGIEGAIKELTWGDAFALVYADVADNTLNIIKNGLRPLSVMFGVSKTTFWWSSESRALDFIAQGRGRSKFMEPFELDDHTLMRVTLGGMKVEEVPLEFTKRSYFPILTDRTTLPWEDSKGAFFPGLSELALSELEQGARERQNNPKEKSSVYLGYEKNTIPLSKAEKLLNKGCCWCGDPCELESTVYFIGADTFVCEENDCINDPLFVEQLGRCMMYPGHLENVA